MTAQRIGFIGLGAMGSRMAARLLAVGYDVVVHNRTRAREDELVALGATRAASPREVVACADITVSCVLDDDAVRQVYLGADGIAASAQSGKLFVEHATFSPALAREVAIALAASGASFVDAPVSGGPEGATTGTLTAMVGGSERDVCLVTDVMRAYSANIVHVGAVGAGLELKLVNQLLVSCHAAAAAEAVQLIGEMKIPFDVAATVLNVSWAGSSMLSRLLQRRQDKAELVSEATIGGLATPQQLVRELLAALELPAPVSAAALDVFDGARARGRGDYDLTELLGAASC